MIPAETLQGIRQQMQQMAQRRALVQGSIRELREQEARLGLEIARHEGALALAQQLAGQETQGDGARQDAPQPDGGTE